jgi:hypothetical protein
MFIYACLIMCDFIIPLPGGGWSDGTGPVLPMPGGGWSWPDGYALPLPGGGWTGEGFDRLPGLNPVTPWGLNPQPRHPGSDGPHRWAPSPWLDPDAVTPWPYAPR